MRRATEFDPASFQGVCAALGIELKPVIDSEGRIDFRLDRAGMEKLTAAIAAHEGDDQ